MAKAPPRSVHFDWEPQPRQLVLLRAAGVAHPFDGGEPQPPMADVILYGGAVGGGKGQPEDGLVATPYGLRKMGDIQVGDRVCSPTHGNSKVIKKYDLGVTDIYRVSFADGTSLDVTGDHLWKVSRVGAGLDKSGLRYRLATTLDIQENLDSGYYDMQIPLPEPVQFTKAYRKNPRTIDPYILGVLLGDGSITQRAKFSSSDEEVANRVEERSGRPITRYTGIEFGLPMEFTSNLREMGLLGRGSATKFIPEPYLYAPVADRFLLAQGIMDSDGYVDERGHVQYTTVSPGLSRDVAFLLRSLGFRVTVSDPLPSYCQGERKQDKYNLYIQGPGKDRLFSLTRKKERCSDPNNDTHKKIVGVSQVGQKQAYCISVDNPNGLYVAGEDLIVTHNSDGLIMLGNLICLMFPGANVAYFRREYPELEGAGGAIMRSQELLAHLGIAKWHGQQRRWTFFNGSTFEFNHCKREEDVYGYNSTQFDVLLIDEASQFTEFQIKYLRTRNRATVDGLTPFTAMASNPGNVGHAFLRREFIVVGEPEIVHDVEVREGSTERHLFIPSFLKDNQVLMDRDPFYIKRLESLPEQERRMLLYGDWDAFSGQAFPEFSRDIHVVSSRDVKIQPWWKKWRANDMGYTDPFAWYWFAVDGDGVVYIYREYTRDPGDERIAYSDQAMQVAQRSMVYNPETNQDEPEEFMFTVTGRDAFNRHPETGRAPVDYYAEGGVRGVIEAPRARQTDRILRKAAFHEFLKPYYDEQLGRETAKLQIFDNCTKLIETLPELIIDPKDPEKVYESPNDHWYDAAGYGLVVWSQQVSRKPEDPLPTIAKHKDKYSRPALKRNRRSRIV